MARLKNIMLGSISLKFFDTVSPNVNGLSQDVLLVLKPGEDIEESLWLVSNTADSSYNVHIVENYLKKNILSRIL